METEQQTAQERFDKLCEELEVCELKVEIRDIFILINEVSKVLYDHGQDEEAIGSYTFTLLSGLKKMFIEGEFYEPFDQEIEDESVIKGE